MIDIKGIKKSFGSLEVLRKALTSISTRVKLSVLSDPVVPAKRLYYRL